jgi:aryl-alcohol dehydrogenase-like predicted oxidoreductase
VQYATIQNTNINVSRVSFGTASLHHLINSTRRKTLLETALSLGVTHFDTSPYYGYGLSELDLGALLKGRRGDLTVSTKVGLYPPTGASQSVFNVWTRKMLGKFNPKLSKPEIDWGLERATLSINASLKRLNTDYVDFLFLHEPDISMIDTEEFTYWIEALKKQGKIRYGGLAGLPNLLDPWIVNHHPLIDVLQTRDGINERDKVDCFSRVGRKPQFTYGYLSEISESNPLKSTDKIMHNALLRNDSGSVIISTRKVDRLKELIGVVR